MREREAKLVVADDWVAPVLDDAIAGATLGPPQRKTTRDVYYDTGDLRLARWGTTLRHRLGEGWTVKLPSSADRVVVDREEVNFPGPPGRPPDDAAATVLPLTRGARLVRVASFSNRREVRRWSGDDEQVIAEFSDDRVAATTCAGNDVEFREIEVELVPGAAGAVLDEVVARLTYGIDPRPAMPKLVRVLGPAAQDPPDVVVPSLGADPTGAELIHAALARSVRRLLLELPRARLAEDPEGVHQARVAARRIRSDLRTFGPLLDDERAAPLRAELRWLARELGEVRDLDVLMGRLGAEVEQLPVTDRVAARNLIDDFAAQRDADLDDLRGHIGDRRSQLLYERLVAIAAGPRTTSRAERPASEVMGRLVAKPWRKLDRAVGKLGDPPAPEQLHEVRILAKRVRYATEAVAPAYGKKARRFARSAAAIQDVLGELNDAAVAEVRLRDTSARLGPEVAYVAGRLTERFHEAARPNHDRWRKAHRRMAKSADWMR